MAESGPSYFGATPLCGEADLDCDRFVSLSECVPDHADRMAGEAEGMIAEGWIAVSSSGDKLGGIR